MLVRIPTARHTFTHRWLQSLAEVSSRHIAIISPGRSNWMTILHTEFGLEVVPTSSHSSHFSAPITWPVLTNPAYFVPRRSRSPRVTTGRSLTCPTMRPPSWVTRTSSWLQQLSRHEGNITGKSWWPATSQRHHKMSGTTLILTDEQRKLSWALEPEQSNSAS